MLNPIIVDAPLKRMELGKTDIDNIYLFVYDNSFKDVDNKPYKMITYLQSLGCMCDLIVENTSYEEKEKLILEYFDCGTFFNLYSLTSTLTSILFSKKGIVYIGQSILSNDETQKFIIKNKEFVDEMIKIFDSIFVLMLMYAIEPTNDMKCIKNKYPSERIYRKELSPNIMNLLLYKDFYNYYDKHITDDILYYEFLFEKSLYKSKSFIDVLTNDENTTLKLLLDINNTKFKDYVMKKGSL